MSADALTAHWPVEQLVAWAVLATLSLTTTLLSNRLTPGWITFIDMVIWGSLLVQLVMAVKKMVWRDAV
jgi:hypothetical protein